MSIQSEITRITGLRDDAFGAVSDMGGTVPADATMEDLEGAIRSIPGPSSILDLVYPVGSLYWSSQATDPGTLFGVGTWTRVKDTFILAAGDNYTAGDTGGAATHTLTVNQLPSHRHQIGQRVTYGTGGGAGAIGYDNSAATSYPYTSYVGGGNPHNNMPPYKVYYCWERTA